MELDNGVVSLHPWFALRPRLTVHTAPGIRTRMARGRGGAGGCPDSQWRAQPDWNMQAFRRRASRGTPTSQTAGHSKVLAAPAHSRPFCQPRGSREPAVPTSGNLTVRERPSDHAHRRGFNSATTGMIS